MKYTKGEWMEAENVKIVKSVISDLKKELLRCENEIARRDIENLIERLHFLVIKDLEKYNDLKEILKKIID